MGRFNNRKTQQRAQDDRNVPSRARFSNWKPPSSKNKKKGRGGGGRGRGRGDDNRNGEKKSGGRGGAAGPKQRAPAANRNKVIQKIQTRTTSKNSKQKNSTRNADGFLRDIDLSKLDEVKFANAESERMIVDILKEFNVIDDDGDDPSIMEDNDNNKAESMNLDDACASNIGAADLAAVDKSIAYDVAADHDCDDDDYDCDDGRLIDNDDGSQQDQNNVTIPGNAVDNDNGGPSPLEANLLDHLMNRLSFSKSDAERAVQKVVASGWGGAASSSKNKDNGSDNEKGQNSHSKQRTMDYLSLAMDWLCLHLTEEELVKGFQKNKHYKPPSSSNAGGSGSMTTNIKAVAHPSISVARLDDNWGGVSSARQLGFIRLGFHQNEIVEACKVNPAPPPNVSALDDYATIRSLLSMVETEVCKEMNHREQLSSLGADLNSADLKFSQMERDEEIMVLESIFADNLNMSNEKRLSLKINPPELKPPARGEECTLHIYPRTTYPTMACPILILTNPSLPPTLLRQINIDIVKFVLPKVGTLVIFEVAEHLTGVLPSMQDDFAKAEKSREFNAFQDKVLSSKSIPIEYDSDVDIGGMSRRQRSKMRAAKKAYKSEDELAEEKRKRLEEQNERISKAKADNKNIRLSRTERLLVEREKERINEEAEKAARAAMLSAFNNGKSTEEARAAADLARKKALNPSDEYTEEDDLPYNGGHDGKADDMNESDMNENENENDDDDDDSLYVPQTTLDFTERLKAFCKDSKLKATRSDADFQDPTIKFTSKDAILKERGHLPTPVIAQSKDMKDELKGVLDIQTQQPWLVSNEARMPAVDVDSKVVQETGTSQDQENKMIKISRRLQAELKQKFKNAELWGKKHPNFVHPRDNRNSGAPAKQFHKMMSQRCNLPAYQMKKEIVTTIAENQVTVVSGDTGCGKTTQVPQLVLDDLILQGVGAGANIIITQPRRISAIGVAERMASERCERIGETVGYSIRLESKRSAKTRLLLCTTGILLRRLQCDPDLASVSHVFVDEVHERDLNTDFLLIILKDLMVRRKSIKVVLMSATLNAESFSTFFGGVPTVSIPGRTHPVQEYRLEHVLQATGYTVMEGSDYALKGDKKIMSRSAVKKLYPKFDRNVHESLAIVDESIINYELLSSLIEHITLNHDEGAILVFVSGFMEITKTIEELRKKAIFTDPSRCVLCPLHSSLTTAEQTAIFDIPERGIRKVVISTNIAETSITIEDVVYVVDAGRVKENRHDEVNQMPTLVECWVSRAAAKQRRGRAGRVKPGIAYHLFSSNTYNHVMDEYQLPEMLRVGLDDLVLQILLLDLGEPSTFLTKAVNPPSALAIRNSLKLLEGLGAIDVDWSKDEKAPITSMNAATNNDSSPDASAFNVNSGLTPLGFHLATLPVDPKIGKMMIYGALFNCVDTALTIAASMSARNPFMSPFEKRDEADAAKKEFSTEESDHLTTLTAFNKWKELKRSARGKSSIKTFLNESFLSQMTLFQMENLRRQFADLLVDIGFLPKGFRLDGKSRRTSSDAPDTSPNANSENMQLVKAVLCAGLYPNVIIAPRELVSPLNTKKVSECAFRSAKGDSVYLHPSTISFSAKRLSNRYCVYHEIMKTSKIYVRDCTPVGEFALLLFGGSLKLFHEKGIVSIDNWILFRINAKLASILKHLRACMENLLLKKIVSPDEDVTGSSEARGLIQAVSVLLETETNKSNTVKNDGSEIVRPRNGNSDNDDRSGGRSGGRGRGRGRGGGRHGNSDNHDRSGGRGGRGRGRGGGRGRGSGRRN